MPNSNSAHAGKPWYHRGHISTRTTASYFPVILRRMCGDPIGLTNTRIHPSLKSTKRRGTKKPSPNNLPERIATTTCSTRKGNQFTLCHRYTSTNDYPWCWLLKKFRFGYEYSEGNFTYKEFDDVSKGVSNKQQSTIV